MNSSTFTQSAEYSRLHSSSVDAVDWHLWGTYLPDRQWGTVRECYVEDGNAWKAFPHDHARSRVYRWGEDGLFGWTDRNCRLCFAPAFWNGKDPILKERLFGLANHEGNHGEDVKEAYYHILNTPTYSYAKALYVYPISAFPYKQLIAENAKLTRNDHEFEIEQTGVLNNNNVFHCTIEYAKDYFDDTFIRISVKNLSADPAYIAVLPTLWIRNSWKWGYPGISKRNITVNSDGSLFVPELLGPGVQRFSQDKFPAHYFYCDQPNQWFFTDNETNCELLFATADGEKYTKDAFHRYLVNGEKQAVNPALEGTKAAMICENTILAGDTWVVNCRLSSKSHVNPFSDSSMILARREEEAQDFYASYQRIKNFKSSEDLSLFAAASSGLLWSCKYYELNLYRWLKGDPGQLAPPQSRWHSDYRNWKYLHAHDIFVMPDAWEYPYFCKWDLMFHAVAFADLDPAFAKNQSGILRTSRYVSPQAQVPAYEWAFSDVDPPLASWATWRIFTIDRNHTGIPDYGFLQESIKTLLLEYGWWSNRNARTDSDLFDGGFLGLDNISPFDRRYPLSDGSRIEQADGTAWMGLLTLYMLKIVVALKQRAINVQHNSSADYSGELVQRFVISFMHSVSSLNSKEERGYLNWDCQDGFYYDLLRRPDGTAEYIRVRSLTGIIPLLAVQSFSSIDLEVDKNLNMDNAILSYVQVHGIDDYSLSIAHLGCYSTGRYLFAMVSPYRLRRVCRWLFDESEFLSDYGIRSLSKFHESNPFSMTVSGITASLQYSPADSPVAMFGGNSNWRGPVWMPINYLLIEALREYHRVLGDDFLIEYPTFSGCNLHLGHIANDLEARLISLFQSDEDKKAPFIKQNSYLDNLTNTENLYNFHEYFNGDDGTGVGASHQTGWTAIVRRMLLHRWGFSGD
ncbi:MGH1-like glycoside hydrolase domain-containing protein [Synechococcus lacustris]|uniref:MGH1-like glycoside hydrolase domain-containing protein n=1 Tax=Synechococcus lacustris TaxID=2116544 RepID=UPI0020CD7620|nr:glucosidase [Synechococcus lacustris]MCP9814120.1 glucosidase [Synechococcus lacustris L1E-Slac]